MSYEFRILGPVGLGCDGEALRLGPPKRKALVTALLLEANRPVPLPRLAGAMWPEPAPRSAVANLRSHVSALRRVLGGRLVAQPRAYELRVEDAELDAAEFARLARAGREALAGGRSEPMPRTLGELTAGYRAVAAGRRALILLDGAAGAGQVRPLLAGAGATLLVTTRRRRLALEQAQQLELAPLPDKEATEVLTGYAGAVRAGSEPAAVRELVRQCHGLPLALRIAGEWLARRPGLPAGLLATHLANRPLDGLRLGDLSVRDALAADLRAVAAEDPLAARAFPLLGPEERVSPEGLASELDEDPSRVFFALERLLDRWLAESPEPGWVPGGRAGQDVRGGAGRLVTLRPVGAPSGQAYQSGTTPVAIWVMTCPGARHSDTTGGPHWP